MKTTSSKLFRGSALVALLAFTMMAITAIAQPQPEQTATPQARASQSAPTAADSAKAAANPAPEDTTPTAPAPAAAEPAGAAGAEDAATRQPAPQAAESEPPLRRIDEPDTATPAAPSAPAAPAAPSVPAAPSAPDEPERRGDDEFLFGDRSVAKDNRVRDAVSVLGSTSVEGEVERDVVSVIGSTRIGPDARVGGAAVAVLGELEIRGRVGDDAVNVLGGVRLEGEVRGEVVSVLGDVTLGPKAVIDGDLVVVGGTLERDPGAVIRGDVVHVPLVGGFGHFEGIVTWFKRCFLMGRPLAFGAHLGWAWAVAGSFLALYLLFALIFPRGIERCATTLETRPGYSLVASVLTVFLTPVAIVLLAVTVVGVVLVPFVGVGLLVAKLFGKAVMLAWIGRRFTGVFGRGASVHPVLAVLIGGVIVLLLYTVPVFGFVLYKLLSWLGLGVVVYTIALSMNREKPPVGVVAGAVPAASVGPIGAPRPASGPSVAPSASGAAQSPMEGPAPGAAGVSSFGAPSADYGSPPPPVTPMPPPVAAGPAISAATLPRAGFLIRMGALLLDVILVALLLALLNGVLPRGFEPEAPSILLLLALYGAVMWKLRGTTIGGIVCGLKIVRADDRPIDWATAIVRALASFLSLFVAGLGFIWIAIDDDRQSWHDKIAGTLVVRVPKGVSLV